jgi:hypothetical protein
MKETILNNWTLWRIVKMALSILFIVMGAIRVDYILLASGVFLFFHTLLNACAMCVGGNCEIPKNNE